MEADNRVDKFSICVAKDQTVVGHSKDGDSGKFAKTIFYFLRSDTYCTGMLKFQGNLKDVTKNQWTTITKIIFMYNSIHKKFEL